MKTGRTRKSPNIRSALLSYSFLGLVLPVFLFGIYLIIQLNSYWENVALSNMEQNLESCADRLDSALYLTSYTASYLITDKDFIANIQAIDAPASDYELYRSRENIRQSIRAMANTTLIAYNASIDVILPTGSVIGNNGYSTFSLEDTEFLYGQSAFETKYVIWHDPLLGEPTSDVTSYWKIYHHRKIIGLIRITLRGSTLWTYAAGSPLFDQDLSLAVGDTLISHKPSGSELSRQAMTMTKDLSLGNIRFAAMIEPGIIYSGMPQAFISLMALFMVLIVILFVIISVITKHITTPIYHLESQMEALQRGDTSEKPILKSYQETEMLSADLNKVASRIDTLITNAAVDAAQKEQLYLDSLMSQIRPHFLYNTLNSIRWMALIDNNTAIADMLSKLGNHLRYSFDRESTFVTVESEVAFLKDYCALQQMRFGNGITFNFDVDEAIMGAIIPRFCIQPFLENCFSHGFEKQSEGRVDIRGNASGGDLIFQIDDNGKGSDDETVSAILNGTYNSEKSSGIGIANVNRRLKLLYGEDYGIRIETAPDQGFHITIKMKRGEG